MILTEYDEEDIMNGFKEEGRQEGIVFTLTGLVNDKLLSIKDAANRPPATPGVKAKSIHINLENPGL